MRLRTCHRKNCGGTFQSKDGRRRFCNKCRGTRLRKARNPNTRPWRRLPAGMTLLTYKLLRRYIDRATHRYKRPELQNWAVKRAFWAKRVLYQGSHELPPPRPEIPLKRHPKRRKSVKPLAVVRPRRPGECYQCGLRLLPKDTGCPRCEKEKHIK